MPWRRHPKDPKWANIRRVQRVPFEVRLEVMTATNGREFITIRLYDIFAFNFFKDMSLQRWMKLSGTLTGNWVGLLSTDHL